VCRFADAVPEILGLVWPSFGPNPIRNRRYPLLYFGREFEIFKGRIGHFGGLGGPGGPWRPFQKVGGFDTFCKGLRGPRGRPDPQNDRFPIFRTVSRFYSHPKCSHVSGRILTSCWGPFSPAELMGPCSPGHTQGWVAGVGCAGGRGRLGAPHRPPAESVPRGP
jgi:hypothetical protein